MKKALFYILQGHIYPGMGGEHLGIRAVTSVKMDRYGKIVMYYGRDCEQDNKPWSMGTRYSPNTIHTFTSEEKARHAKQAMILADKDYTKQMDELRARERELRRAHDIAVNRAASIYAVVLEDHVYDES